MADLPVAVTIAGSDSGGGAGIAADLRTFAAHQVWGAAVITAITAQNTLGVQAVEAVPAAMITAQLHSVLDDLAPSAVKVGMLGTAEAVLAVADALAARPAGPIVVDPVLQATAGGTLLAAGALEPLTTRLLPLARLVTPNLAEAAALSGLPVEGRDGMVEAGARILLTGVGAVLVTGGHLSGKIAADCLVRPEAPPQWFEGERIDAAGTHGTGCVLSAAVAARLARGQSLVDACAGAKRYVVAALKASVRIGAGEGAVNPPPIAL